MNEATKEFFGYLVEIDCGEEGRYKGLIAEVEPADNDSCKWGNVKLDKPSRNGVPLGVTILIPGELVNNIKILKMPGLHGVADVALSKPVKKIAHRVVIPTVRSGTLRNIKPSIHSQPRTTGTQFVNNRFSHLAIPVQVLKRGKVSQPICEKQSTKVEAKKPIGTSDIERTVKMLNAGTQQQKVGGDNKKHQGTSRDSGSSRNLGNNSTAMASTQQLVGQFGQGRRTTPIHSVPRMDGTQFINQFRQPTGTMNFQVLRREKKVLSISPPINEEDSTKTEADEKKQTVSATPMLQYGQFPQRPKKILNITPPPDKEGTGTSKSAQEVLPKEKKEVNVNKKVEEAVVDSRRKEKVNVEKRKVSVADSMQQRKRSEEENSDRNNAKKKEERNRREKERRAQLAVEKAQRTKNKAEEDKMKNSKGNEKEGLQGSSKEMKAEAPKEGTEVKTMKMEPTAEQEKIVEQLNNLKIKTAENTSTVEKEASTVSAGQLTASSFDESTSELEQIVAAAGEEAEEAPATAEDYVGSLATIHCDQSNDFYQGLITAIDPQDRTVRLDKPMLNGLPLRQPFIVLPAYMMKDIRILKRGETSPSSSSVEREIKPLPHYGGTPGSIYMQSSPRPPPTPPPQMQKRRLSPAIRAGRSSYPAPPTPPAQLMHQAYGDFKKFVEPQVPTPVRLQMNARQSPNGNTVVTGPTGIPAVDCMNGYRGYNKGPGKEDSMGDALDYETLNTDFDFASNLALFNKTEFVRKTENIFHGLDTGGNNSRNYRHNENVIMDSSRVISWANGAARGFSTTPPSKSKTKRHW